MRCGGFALLVALAAAAPLGAQQWRTVDVSRQLRDTSAHDVRVRYAAGSLKLRGTDEPVLFAMHLRYDEDAVTPVHRYDAAERSLTLGIDDASTRLARSAGRQSHGELRVSLSHDVPIRLDLELGAAEARLDLGGMSLRDLKIETGASDSKLRFDRPNRVRMERLEVGAGAANIEVTGVSNANVRTVHVRSGVGNVDLQFDGPLPGDVDIDAEMALGRVAVAVPLDAGVRVELSRFLAGFEHFGLVRRGDAWYSDNWDHAAHRVNVKVRTVFGRVVIERENR